MTEALSFLDPLRKIPGIRVDFVERVDGVDVDGERDEVLERLGPAHRSRIQALSLGDGCWKAEQVHGAGVAVVSGGLNGDDEMIPGVDGLVTDQVATPLGIYVADCGAIWLADRRSGAVGLLHSGKKGTELNILKAGVDLMSERYGTQPKDVVAVLGPCIRPPHYEVDFAASIAAQAAELGLGEYHDCGLDTAADLARYYSYRMEKGRTGRMLALILRDGESS